MSMLSSKCDRLRETAIRVEIFLEGCTDAIPMDTHEQLRSAANIIWELRNKLDGVVDQSERIAELEAENAKLRELCGDLFDRLMDKDEHCGECRSQCEHDAWNFGDPKCVYAKRMRELGIGDWREELRVG